MVLKLETSVQAKVNDSKLRKSKNKSDSKKDIPSVGGLRKVYHFLNHIGPLPTTTLIKKI